MILLLLLFVVVDLDYSPPGFTVCLLLYLSLLLYLFAVVFVVADLSTEVNCCLFVAVSFVQYSELRYVVVV